MTANNPILTDFEAWQKDLFSTLVTATKASNAISAGDVSFYRSLDRKFAANMDEASSITLDLTNELLKQAGGPNVDAVKDADDMNDRFDVIVDVVDNMLEKVDVAMDEMKAPKKKGSSVIPQSAPIVASAKANQLEYKLIHAQNIARPQLRFPDAVDNSSSTPFVRKIRTKPNAKVDLNYGMDRTSGESTELVSQPHPYEYEINHLEYPAHMFEQRPEQLYHPFDTTSAIWVDTEETLKDMCKSLEMQREIAIDLEHHNYRSYQGFVCLMQISTRDQDYVIDTLELRGSLHLLNQSFTDPNIVKVLHGADSDIIWLQRDFGVYIVNLFDTYHASKYLEMASHSLAHLLKLYADYDADKRYQLADWRIRPLPKEMYQYARSDTHFLLYVYDRMRNSLLDKSNSNHNLLHATLQRSAEVALKKHEKEVYDAEGGDGPNGWRNMYSKWNRALDNQQFAVFLALHAWRDQTAREEDESLRFVLPNHMLFTLAEKMPVEAAGVLGCCTPVPPPVKMNATDIAMLIARTKASVKPLAGGFKPVEIDEPVHVRFDPKTGLQGTVDIKKAKAETPFTTTAAVLAAAAGAKAPAEKSNQGGKVVAAATSGMFGAKAVQAPALADPTPLMAKRSGMFGDMPLKKGSTAQEEAKKIAKKIIQELSMQSTDAAPAVFKEVTSVAEAAAAAAKEAELAAAKEAEAAKAKAEAEEVVFTPAEERVTKQKRTDVLVLSSLSKKRSRAIDEDRAELKKEVVEAAMAAGKSLSDAEEEAAAAEVVSIKKKKSKKDKQLSSASTPASSAPASGDEQTDAFEPFDYNTVRSVVDETIDNVTMSKRKQKKKKAAAVGAALATEPPAPFDPYNKLIEGADFKKKDATFSSKPKSGSRSMTFNTK